MALSRHPNHPPAIAGSWDWWWKRKRCDGCGRRTNFYVTTERGLLCHSAGRRCYDRSLDVTVGRIECEHCPTVMGSDFPEKTPAIHADHLLRAHPEKIR